MKIAISSGYSNEDTLVHYWEGGKPLCGKIRSYHTVNASKTKRCKECLRIYQLVWRVVNGLGEGNSVERKD